MPKHAFEHTDRGKVNGVLLIMSAVARDSLYRLQREEKGRSLSKHCQYVDESGTIAPEAYLAIT